MRKVNMTISLAFLAPGLVKAAIDGRLPHDRTRNGQTPWTWRIIAPPSNKAG